MAERLAIDQSQLLVGVALTGSRKSKNVVKWAVENFLPKGDNVTFKLIHVYPKITIVPTPMGTWLPASQVGKDVLNCYRKQVKLNKQTKLIPHQKKLIAQKIKADIILLESDDIPMALSMEITKQSIRHLVIGITSASIFSMKTLSMIKGSDISQAILQNAPNLCSVYVIENDAKLKQLRPADLESGVITMDNASNVSHISTNSSSSSSSLAIDKKSGAGLGCSKSSIELPGQIRLSKETIELEHYAFKNTYFDSCNVSVRNSSSSSEDSDSWISYQISPEKTIIVSTQATTSYVATSQTKVNEISKQRIEEASKLMDEKDQELLTNKNKNQEVKNEVKDKSENYGKNMSKKKQGTKLAHQEDEEIKNKLLESLFASPSIQFQKFTWEEIMEATSSLSDEFKIGTGSFGTVYKCKLHHTTVAIKVLHSKNDCVINKQFVQELAILSTIRHPHLLMLLGAVPEESCLVYEYMDYGNLDDRLFKKKGKPPLPWYDRFRICYEVAGALAFLHNTRPRPIIHRDLKPSNILLDHNLVSKIGDAGLATMINNNNNNNNLETTDVPLETIYKETSPVGTLSYIDPEYQRTGKVSTKSDTYALGVVILQMLTTKSAVGITYMVEDAMINEGTLNKILDPEAGQWPEKETIELALLGLECAQLRGKDRPNLTDKVLPILERFNVVADTARELASIPQHYFCPILKDMMEDPYVAADGYTYERSAIEQWLTKNDTSPTTNQTLPHKSIIPNTTLLQAIKQWNSNNMAKLDKLHTQKSRS